MSLRDRVFAAGYDPLAARWEKEHGTELRRQLLAHARGRVLEIGVGTGLSLPHYPPVDELVATDPSVPMLRRLYRRFGTWKAPTVAVVVFAIMFSLSAFVIGPAISGTDQQEPAPSQIDPEHSEHHG